VVDDGALGLLALIYEWVSACISERSGERVNERKGVSSMSVCVCNEVTHMFKR
jgi:hypothetical protein